MENASGKNPAHVARDNNIFDTDQVIELIKQIYFGEGNHLSVSRNKQNSSTQRFPCGNENCLTTANEVLKLL